MKIHIIAYGKSPSRSPESQLVTRYLSRIPWPTTLTELADHQPVSAAPPNSRTVALDERGKPLTSQDLANQLSKWREAGTRETRFLLGPANGHTPETRATADLTLSFGPATWPHLLARAMLAEQLYRAHTILTNHPYHRE